MQLKLHLAVVFCFVSIWASAESARDIFNNTNETRRKALDSEHEMVIGLGGCSGFLLAPNIGGSAAHCQKTGAIKSGIAIRDGKGNDGSIVRTLEVGQVSDYDYWIFEIKWNDGTLPHGMRVVPFIQVNEFQVMVGSNDWADKIYTLGFPVDLSDGRTLYNSWGYGKKIDGKDHVNNISMINGNSGGGLFRNSDDMLVSIVSGGPHAHGQSGWNNNDWNDATHWNWGPAMVQVYRQSAQLKAIFPGGVNRHRTQRLEDVSPVHFLSSQIN